MKVPLRVSFFTKSLSKGYFFLHRVSLRVPKSGLASLSKGKGPEIRSAHTRHPSTLVPPGSKEYISIDSQIKKTETFSVKPQKFETLTGT